MEYMCTKFGVDSSSRFSFEAWTRPGTQVTDATDHRTHASANDCTSRSDQSSLNYAMPPMTRYHNSTAQCVLCILSIFCTVLLFYAMLFQLL